MEFHVSKIESEQRAWLLVSRELVNMECFVLEHSSEVCCVGWQVSLYLFAEARVACKFQIGIILSWAIHHLNQNKTKYNLGKTIFIRDKRRRNKLGVGFVESGTLAARKSYYFNASGCLTVIWPTSLPWQSINHGWRVQCHSLIPFKDKARSKRGSPCS